MMDSWILQPVFNTYIVLAIAAVVFVLLLVRPSFSQLAPKRRWILVWIRFGVICMAMLAMLRPGCVQKIEKNQSAVLLFLVDVSRSMELPHHSDNSTRWGTLVKSIEENRERIAKLKENKIETRFFAFDNQVRPCRNPGKGQFSCQMRLTERKPILARPFILQRKMCVTSGLVGVIVASDGVQNATYPEVELTRATDNLRDTETPLYAMTLGLAGDTGQLADIAITNLPEQHRVSKKNVLTVKSTMIARGYPNQPITVQLIIVDQDGNEQAQPAEVYTPAKAYEEIEIRLKYVPPEAGRFRMRGAGYTATR